LWLIFGGKIFGVSQSIGIDGWYQSVILILDLEAIITSCSRSDGHHQIALDDRSSVIWTMSISTDREWKDIVLDEYQLQIFNLFLKFKIKKLNFAIHWKSSIQNMME